MQVTSAFMYAPVEPTREVAYTIKVNFKGYEPLMEVLGRLQKQVPKDKFDPSEVYVFYGEADGSYYPLLWM